MSLSTQNVIQLTLGSIPVCFAMCFLFEMILLLFGHFFLRSNRSLELQDEQTEEMKTTFLTSFSGDCEFPCRLFFLIFAAKRKNMHAKIELDSSKEWVRNSALQMTTFCRNLELGEIESSSSGNDLQNFGKNWCVNETVAWRFQNADV